MEFHELEHLLNGLLLAVTLLCGACTPLVLYYLHAKQWREEDRQRKEDALEFVESGRVGGWRHKRDLKARADFLLRSR